MIVPDGVVTRTLPPDDAMPVAARVLEQMRAGLGRHPRRADDQLQRMDMAGAGVARAAEIVRRAEPLGRLGRRP